MDLSHIEALKEIGCSARLRIKPLNGLNLDIQDKSRGHGSWYRERAACGSFLASSKKQSFGVTVTRVSHPFVCLKLVKLLQVCWN